MFNIASQLLMTQPSAHDAKQDVDRDTVRTIDSSSHLARLPASPYPDTAIPVNEAEAISRSRDGDVQAFNVLVERYQSRVYGLSYRMLGDAEAAADTTQDTWVSAFRNIRRYRGGSFVAWLLRIAINACYDQLRARKRRQQISLDALDPDSDAPPRQLAASGEAPDESVLRRELAREIQRQLQELPTEQRLVVILSDIHDYSYRQIAAVTGWPSGTVKSRLSRGRSRLRAALRDGDLLPVSYMLSGADGIEEPLGRLG